MSLEKYKGNNSNDWRLLQEGEANMLKLKVNSCDIYWNKSITERKTK